MPDGRQPRLTLGGDTFNALPDGASKKQQHERKHMNKGEGWAPLHVQTVFFQLWCDRWTRG